MRMAWALGLVATLTWATQPLYAGPSTGTTSATDLIPPPQPATPWGPKAIGVLIVGENGGPKWRKTIAAVAKFFHDRYPVESLYGNVGPRDLQRAVDRLQEAKARKIVLIPLRLSSKAADIDQIQYMLGIREYPSRGFMETSRMSQTTVSRVKANVPIVMTSALDDDPLVASMLLDRALEISREPTKEIVVLVGPGAATEEGTALRLKLVESLARKMSASGRFMRVLGAVMRPEPALEEGKEPEDNWAKPDLRLSRANGRNNGDELRELIRRSSLKSRVLVVPYILDTDGTDRAIREKIDGLFFRWTGNGLLYDDRIVQWVNRKTAEALRVGDMVKFRDAGKALPPTGRKKFVP